MIRIRVDERLVLHAIRLERCLVGRPTRVDPFVESGVMEHQRRLDFGDIGSAGLSAVERHCRREIRQTYGEQVDRGSAEAKAHGADFAGAFGA